MDRTLVNLLSLLIGGAGIFSVLTKYSVPEVNQSFYGTNPFLIKSDAIEKVTTWAYTLLALSALGVQIWAELWGNTLPARRHSTSTYVWFGFAAIVVLILLVVAIARISSVIARKSWEPIIIELQRELFRNSLEVVQNDGWYLKQIRDRDNEHPEAASARQRNLDQSERSIAQLERLIEVTPTTGTLRERLRRLESLFQSDVAV